ncbi:MAG: hypothetical protein P8L85_21885 [Rubripirellula sp.]|nr:hypothetical protein [Rubripirellula sp.]
MERELAVRFCWPVLRRVLINPLVLVAERFSTVSITFDATVVGMGFLPCERVLVFLGEIPRLAVDESSWSDLHR